MTRRHASQIAAAIALAALAAWYFKSNVPGGAATGAAVAITGERSPAGHATVRPARTEASARKSLPSSTHPVVLPPLDTPLAGVFPTLERAARAGDLGAMCRLAVELERCTSTLEKQRKRARTYSGLLDARDAENASNLIAMLAQISASLERTEAICAGVALPEDLEPWELLRDSARAGHVPSMLRFVREFPISPNELMQRLDVLAVYRDEAPGFLRRAAASGDVYGAHAMYWALQGQPAFAWPGFQPVEKNPVQLLAYAIALEGFTDERGRTGLAKREAMLRRKLSEADERRADAEAQRITAVLDPSRGAEVSMGLGGGLKSGEECARLPP